MRPSIKGEIGNTLISHSCSRERKETASVFVNFCKKLTSAFWRCTILFTEVLGHPDAQGNLNAPEAVRLAHLYVELVHDFIEVEVKLGVGEFPPDVPTSDPVGFYFVGFDSRLEELEGVYQLVDELLVRKAFQKDLREIDVIAIQGLDVQVGQGLFQLIIEHQGVHGVADRLI